MRSPVVALAIVSLLLLGATPLGASAVRVEQNGTEVVGSGMSQSGECTPSQNSVCDPLAMAFDQRGNLWIADGQSNRVLEFPLVTGNYSNLASTVIGQQNFTTGVCGAGVWPSAIRSSTLCFPDGLAFDSRGNLWVADGGGSRVVEFPLLGGSISHQPREIIGPNFTSVEPFSPLHGISLPVGIAFDHSGNLWVTDLGFSRVLEFPFADGSIASAPSRAIGQGNLGESSCDQSTPVFNFANATSSNLCLPSDIAFDQKGNLWVADFGQDPSLLGNSRVVMFPYADGRVSATASAVIGQGDFYSSGCNRERSSPGNDTLCYPVSLAFDSPGNLWVADSGNSRVLEFPSTGDGISTSASQVVGQVNFTSGKCNVGAAANVTRYTLCRPLWIALDSHNGLWVSDTNNQRVMQFAVESTPSSAPPAWLLLGGAVASLLVVIYVVMLRRKRLAPTHPQSQEQGDASPSRYLEFVAV